MGTGGSRYGAGRPAYRPTTGSYRRLDIRRMVKDGCIKPDHWFSWQWRNDEGEEVASVSCKVNQRADGLNVSYSWSAYHQPEKQSADIYVWLDTTPCNYGGVRWWFRCPCCSRRAAALYITGCRLRCIRCGRFSYASQRGDAMDRAWIKQRKIEAKLIDGWDKPKGMHWKTYDRLHDEILECERKKDIALMKAMARFGFEVWNGQFYSE